MSNRPYPTEEPSVSIDVETSLVESQNPVASQVVYDAVVKNCVFGKSWALHESCVMLNGQNEASDTVMATTQDNSTFLRPVRNISNNRLLMYNTTTHEVSESTYVNGNIEIGTTEADPITGTQNVNVLRIGSVAGNYNSGALAHPNYCTPTDFALGQAGTTGTTILNCPNGSSLLFCKNGSPRFQLTSADEFACAVHMSISGSKFMYVYSGGVWIQRFIAISATHALAADSFLATSDDRFKHNEVELSTMDCTSIIKRLKPKYYQKTSTMLDASHTGVLDIPYSLESGLIAQEIDQIPELQYCVTKDKDDPAKAWSVDYGSINMYLLSTVQSLIARVEELEKKITN